MQSGSQGKLDGLGGIGQAILDLLFPPQCVGCGDRGAWLCRACRLAIPSVPSGMGCPDQLDAFACAYAFDGALRKAIHAFKYKGARHLAEPLGALMLPVYASQFARALPPGGYTAIVPVPLFPGRQRARGYNQSELLAEVLAAELNIPVNLGLVRRVKDTRSQMKLNASERQQNMHGAFAANAGVNGASILLLDDVCTTGATIDACAAALRDAGCDFVGAICLARAL